MYTNSRIGDMRIDLQTIVLNEWFFFFFFTKSRYRMSAGLTNTRILLRATSYYSRYILYVGIYDIHIYTVLQYII